MFILIAPHAGTPGKCQVYSGQGLPRGEDNQFMGSESGNKRGGGAGRIWLSNYKRAPHAHWGVFPALPEW